jgi:hypothetical protein
MTVALDHLVVAARTLEEGAAWVEQRFGVTTVPGGRHALMGTHNRLLSLGGRTYLEVIAIDPEGVHPARPRWFGLDRPEVQAALAKSPRLLHWVCRSDDLEGARAVAAGAFGPVIPFVRGDYRWRITVPDDGGPPMQGELPTLIEWEGERHPSDRLPESGCVLKRLAVELPEGADSRAHLIKLGVLPPVAVVTIAPCNGARLRAEIGCPRGTVVLEGKHPVGAAPRMG